MIYPSGDGRDRVYDFNPGIGGDLLSFGGLGNIDVVGVSDRTEFRVSDGNSGNNKFGKGRLLLTLEDTSGFTQSSIVNGTVQNNEVDFFFN